MKYPSREFAICRDHSNCPVIAFQGEQPAVGVPRTTLPSLMAPPRWVFNVSGPFGLPLVQPHYPACATVHRQRVVRRCGIHHSVVGDRRRLRGLLSGNVWLQTLTSCVTFFVLIWSRPLKRVP